MLAPYLDFQIGVSIETLVKGVAKPDAIVCVCFTCILVDLIKVQTTLFHSHTCQPNQSSNYLVSLAYLSTKSKFKLPWFVLAQPRAKKFTTHVHCGCDSKTILEQIPIGTHSIHSKWANLTLLTLFSKMLKFSPKN